MATIGTTQRRVVVALLLTALLPLVSTMGLATAAIRQVSRSAFQPEFREQLERSLSVYRDLARSMKSAMASEATAIAAAPALSTTARTEDAGKLDDTLREILVSHPSLVSIAVERADGASVARRERARALDAVHERPFEQRRLLGDGASAPVLLMVFAAERQRFDEMAAAQNFALAYEKLEASYRDATMDSRYAALFSALLFVTVLLAVGVGVLVVRPVTRRVENLLDATRLAAEGDLSVRVACDGPAELAELGSAFNRMFEQLDRSRARIDFLKRLGQWQTMARRLAHEIKNPLTPIQLAVEECVQRYHGDDAAFAEMLATTRDIVTEEVSALRRLVGEFAAFARLPRATLAPGDLGEFVREQWPRLSLNERPDADGRPVALLLQDSFEAIPVALDKTMLYRALVNLIDNAMQASAAREDGGTGQVQVACSISADAVWLTVDDDGEGVPQVLKPAVFDPYVTTKKTGTGLGLSITKKIVIDHGGTVEVEDSKLGGARFVVRLPLVGSAESEAALARSHAGAWTGTGSRPALA
ncbi:MAG: HAMP domain-containing protein [Myxococcales bacterium]|nr:HAMP domain-containing protein [Myxococcales bacterium]